MVVGADLCVRPGADTQVCPYDLVINKVYRKTSVRMTRKFGLSKYLYTTPTIDPFASPRNRQLYCFGGADHNDRLPKPFPCGGDVRFRKSVGLRQSEDIRTNLLRLWQPARHPQRCPV